MASKSPSAFRSISEAAAELSLPAHVLRFWETRFAFVRPTRGAGGRRLYRPADIHTLAAVRRLLREGGMTIEAVQALHRRGGVKRLIEATRDIGGASKSETRQAALAGALAALTAAKLRLDRALSEG